MDPIPKTALETIAVQQGHEKLKVLFLAVVRGGRHKEKMASERGEEPPEVIAFGIFDLAAEEGG